MSLAMVSTRMPRTVISMAGPSTLCTKMGMPNSWHAVKAVLSSHTHSIDFALPCAPRWVRPTRGMR